MKKGAALLAGVLAAAAVLSGCGGQGNNGSTTSADSAAAESTTEGNAKASGEKVTISLLSWNTDEILGEFIAGFEQENPNTIFSRKFKEYTGQSPNRYRRHS